MRLFRWMALAILVSALVWIVPGPFDANAQVQEVRENTGSAAAWRALLRLRTTATVMHTTAHPDDEDGALLAHLFKVASDLAQQFGVHQKGYRTTFNVNTDAGQTVYHLHLHVMGGRRLSWP